MIDERNIFTKGMLINLTMGAYWDGNGLSGHQILTIQPIQKGEQKNEHF
jgi:hypothetical protein